VPVDNDNSWLSLYDCLGRELIKVRLTKNQIEETLEIAHLGTGVYFTTVVGSNRGFETRKILIQ